MAPEHPFPTPTNDCFTVAKYVVENYKKFNINPDKLIIAGDSAGCYLKQKIKKFMGIFLF